jgi:hypothetical protein
MKKLLTLLFAVALTLSLSSVSFAQDAAGSTDKPMDKKADKADKTDKKATKKKAKKTKKDDMKKDDMKSDDTMKK